MRDKMREQVNLKDAELEREKYLIREAQKNLLAALDKGLLHGQDYGIIREKIKNFVKEGEIEMMEVVKGRLDMLVARGTKGTERTKIVKELIAPVIVKSTEEIARLMQRARTEKTRKVAQMSIVPDKPWPKGRGKFDITKVKPVQRQHSIQEDLSTFGVKKKKKRGRK